MRYTEEHQWLLVEGDLVVVGVTEHAVEELGEIVFVELPEIEATVTRGDEVVVIESATDSADILSPLDGEIAEVNDALVRDPGLINEDPIGDGWLFKIAPEDISALEDFMNDAEYRDFAG